MTVASHMEEMRRTVRELAATEPDGSPVISLYLDTRWSDQHQRERARLFLHRRAAEVRAGWKGNPFEKEIAWALDELIDRVMRDLVEQGEPSEVSWDGFAFFVGLGREPRVGLRSRVPFQNQFELDERPRLLQTARLIEEHRPAFVVLVDGRWMRIFEVALGSVLLEADLEQYLPDRVNSGDRGPFANRWPGRVGPAGLARSGGMSQMRMQRHIRDHLEHNLKNGSELLSRLAEHEPGAPVVLCGEEELRAIFRRALPDAVRRRVTVEMRLDSKSPRHQVLRSAIRELVRLGEAERNIEIDQVIGLALGSGLSVLGTEDVMLAVQESRLHTLYLDLSAGLGAGWACINCTAFGRKAEVGCPFCGAQTTTVDLVEELVRRAIADETRVVVVDGHTRLRHYRGLAGSLRRGISPTATQIGFAGHEPLPPM